MSVFILLELWHLNSPDLNPVHCRYKATMQQRAYLTDIHSCNELKQRLIQFCSDAILTGTLSIYGYD